MAWIKFEKDLLTDPRVLRIARSLQSRWMLFDHQEIPEKEQFTESNASALPAVTLVCGALTRIWSLADTHLGDDDILPLGIEELNDHIGIPGFCELMPADWIQEIDEHAVKLPEFHEHNGTEAKKKAQGQKRQERYRNNNKKALRGGNAGASLDQTRPDKTNKSNARAHSAPAAPSKLVQKKPGIETLVAMGVEEQAARDWLTVRKEKRAPLTQTALDELAREAGKAGITVAMAVQICARRSWQGFNATWNWSDADAKGAVNPESLPWWKTSSGIEKRGSELHVNKVPGEQFPYYKARVFEAAGSGPWVAHGEAQP